MARYTDYNYIQKTLYINIIHSYMHERVTDQLLELSPTVL